MAIGIDFFINIEDLSDQQYEDLLSNINDINDENFFDCEIDHDELEDKLILRFNDDPLVEEVIDAFKQHNIILTPL